MQGVYGPLVKEIVHYEAPPAGRMDLEMNRFLLCFLDCFKRAVECAGTGLLDPFLARAAQVARNVSMERHEDDPGKRGLIIFSLEHTA
jgi:hypothetical protein